MLKHLYTFEENIIVRIGNPKNWFAKIRLEGLDTFINAYISF